MKEKIFYTYVYLDPRKPGLYQYGDLEFCHEPFWVGKGHGKRYKIQEHLNDTNRQLVNKINKIGLDNIIIQFPITDEYNYVSEDCAFLYEQLYIEMIGRKDLETGPLCNLTNGGEGTSGRIFSEETKLKMRKKALNRAPISEETKQKHRLNIIERYNSGQFIAPFKYNKHLPESRKKISNSLFSYYSNHSGPNKNKVMPEEQKEKIRQTLLKTKKRNKELRELSIV